MPKIVDHDEYRKELMTRCRDLFSKKGYANVTMREIAKELRVSTGTLYHYFPTKQDIFEQIFKQEMTMDVEEVISSMGDVDSQSGRIDRVIGHWDEKRDYYHNIVLLAIDFFRSHQGKDSKRLMNEYSTYYRHAMAEMMKLPREIASAYFMYVIGIMYHDLLVPGSFKMREYLDLFKEMALAYIEKKDGDQIREDLP